MNPYRTGYSGRRTQQTGDKARGGEEINGKKKTQTRNQAKKRNGESDSYNNSQSERDSEIDRCERRADRNETRQADEHVRNNTDTDYSNRQGGPIVGRWSNLISGSHRTVRYQKYIPPDFQYPFRQSQPCICDAWLARPPSQHPRCSYLLLVCRPR